MFISFPPIPLPDIPKAPSYSQVISGTSSSSSKVIVCIDNKCLTREQKTSSGSSFLKVKTVSEGDSTTTTSVESFDSDGWDTGSSIYSKVPIRIREAIGKWAGIIKKYLTKF